MTETIVSPELLAMFVCPVCHGKLALDGSRLGCAQCGRKYPIEDGIPVLLADRAENAH